MALRYWAGACGAITIISPSIALFLLATVVALGSATQRVRSNASIMCPLIRRAANLAVAWQQILLWRPGLGGLISCAAQCAVSHRLCRTATDTADLRGKVLGQSPQGAAFAWQNPSDQTGRTFRQVGIHVTSCCGFLHYLNLLCRSS